jgi:MOB kinase activator 1
MFPGANKTLRQRDHAKGGKREKLSQYAKKTLATLGSGSMRSAVALPKGEDMKEWVAVNTVDFFNEINLLYGTISEFCTKEKCPVMSAGASVNYLWRDGVKVKKPTEVSAPEYVDLLMTWAESQLNDETIFPISFGSEYPKNFMPIVKQIYKRFFRVYAHIYHSHFSRIVRVGAEAHLNTCFKHFIFFVKEFKLIDDKELKPLEDLINKIMGPSTSSSGGKDSKDKSGSTSGSTGTSSTSSASSSSSGSSGSTASTSSTSSPTTSMIGH